MVTPDNYNPKEYKPSSCFFADYTNLATASTAIETIKLDSFGPVPTGLDSANKLIYSSSQYRTTSFVRAKDATPVKVLAVCAGRILIQPSTASGKVNIILIPKDGISSLRIKYFVYRNVTKDDLLLNSTTMQKTDSNTFTAEHPAPEMLTNMWDNYTKSNKGVRPPTLDSVNIGYNESATGDTLIDAYLANLLKDGACRIYDCKAGEHLGYFTEKLGLDVVLDYGDCTVTKQNQQFVFNLSYARQSDHVLKTASITQIKQYKENIFYFLDAAAFWGSHIKCGTIQLYNVANSISSAAAIYSNILCKYQTAGNIYVYIKESMGRSYGYYDSVLPHGTFDTSSNAYAYTTLSIDRKVLFSQTQLLSDSNPTETYSNINARTDTGWPIYIKSYTITADTTIYGYLEAYSDTSNIETDYSIDMFASSQTSSEFPSKNTYNVLRPTVTDLNYIAYVNSKGSSCANFVMINCNITQLSPLTNYYNKLFLANVVPVGYSKDSTDTYTRWAILDQNRVVNLYPIFNMGAKIYNKVVTDTGSYLDSGGNTVSVKRRLFMAIIRENSNQQGELGCNQYQNLNITPTISSYGQVSSAENYALDVYNNKNLAVYKGQFTDNSGVSVNSLSLVNANNWVATDTNKNFDFITKKSYFQLGITETDYQAFFGTSSTLPADADNIYFRLKEIFSPEIQVSDYRKFKLGLAYETNTGAWAEYFPATGSEIYVYTMDGFYFFSAAYSASQPYCSTFADVSINFRPEASSVTDSDTYSHYYGFDWLRVGDNNAGSYKEIPYAQIITNAYRSPYEFSASNYKNSDRNDYNTTYSEIDGIQSTANGYTSVYDSISNEKNNAYGLNAYKALQQEYNSIPTNTSNSIAYKSISADNYPIVDPSIVLGYFPKTYSQYYIPYLNLFPSDATQLANIKKKANISDFIIDPPTQAELTVLITKNNPSTSYDYSFEYNTKLFHIPDKIADKPKSSYSVSITITCLKQFSADQQINIWATDTTGKKMAGMIIVRSNTTLQMKYLNVLFIPVVTQSGVTYPIEDFPKYKEKLQKVLFQNYIIVNAIDYKNNGSTEFDLSGDANFQSGGAFLDANNNIYYDNNKTPPTKSNTGKKFFPYLKNTFLQTGTNRQVYNGSQDDNYDVNFLLFFFPNAYSDAGTGGITASIGTELSVVFYKITSTTVGSDTGIAANPDLTVTHEVLHGLGLEHSFRNISSSGYENLTPTVQRFIFYDENPIKYPVTDNLMSYNQISRSSTWKWQWDILDSNSKLKKK
jgi:hypothetical protein